MTGLLIGVGLEAQSATARTKVEELIEAGIVADDFGKYPRAEKLLGEACELARATGDPEGSHRSCLKLANTYSVQGRYEFAKQTLEESISALERWERARPADIVVSLLELANIRAALADFDSSRAALQRIGPYLDRLATAEKVKAYIQIAEFFLPIDRQASGGDALRAAREVLETSPEHDDDDYVYAAYALGRALENAGRLQEADYVLRPFVDQARERFDRDGDIPGRLGRAYLSLANRYANVVKARGLEQESKQLKAETAVWRKQHGPMGPSLHPPIRKGQKLIRPKILKRQNPKMTKGAFENRARGRVELSVEVWPDGRVHNITVSRSLPYGLHWAAIGAARNWRFRPATVDGEPIKFGAVVSIDFSFR